MTRTDSRHPKSRLGAQLLAGALATFALIVPAAARDWPGIERLDPPINPVPGFNSVFGRNCAISGDWAAVGDGGNFVIYMYRRESTGWEYVHSLRGPFGSFKCPQNGNLARLGPRWRMSLRLEALAPPS